MTVWWSSYEDMMTVTHCQDHVHAKKSFSLICWVACLTLLSALPSLRHGWFDGGRGDAASCRYFYPNICEAIWSNFGPALRPFWKILDNLVFFMITEHNKILFHHVMRNFSKFWPPLADIQNIQNLDHLPSLPSSITQALLLYWKYEKYVQQS